MPNTNAHHPQEGPHPQESPQADRPPVEGRTDRIPLALIQTHASDDPKDNTDRTLALVEQAARNGAKLIVTQELFRSRYFPQVEDEQFLDLAEPVPGPTTEVFAKLAKAHGAVLALSLFERRAAGLYHNTSVVLERDGSVAGRYRKMHIPDDPRFYEKYYFTPGDLGFQAIRTSVGTLGTLICWDQWYPEAARLTAMRGADILIYPTAIGTWDGELELRDIQHDAWRTTQRAHAISNGVFVAAANRIGTEDALQFWGGSFVVGPDGQVIAEADDTETILEVEIDLAKIEETRRGWPFLRDRRIDAYGDLTQRWLDDAPDG